MQDGSARWKLLCEETWNSSPLSPFMEQSQKLAGGWKEFFLSKAQHRGLLPSHWEVKAALLHLLMHKKMTSDTPANKAFFVLIDGSESVTPGKLQGYSDGQYCDLYLSREEKVMSKKSACLTAVGSC